MSLATLGGGGSRWQQEPTTTAAAGGGADEEALITRMMEDLKRQKLLQSSQPSKIGPGTTPVKHSTSNMSAKDQKSQTARSYY
jgi:hypothetical protein